MKHSPSYRKWHEEPFRAAVVGIHEFPVRSFTMTLTLAAVMRQFAFSPGRTGKVVLEFALTLAGAVLSIGSRGADAPQ